MKKISLILSMALVAVISLSSCSEPKERLEEGVAMKIQNNEPLSNEDVTLIINYVGEYAEKAQPLYDDIINGANEEQMKEVNEKLMALNEDFPVLNLFRNKIKTLPAASIDAENMKLLQKYGQYLEFSMPVSVSYQTLPGVAGLEMQSPTDPTAKGVVADPQLETKTTGRGW